MEQGIGALTSDFGRAAQAKAQQMQRGGASLDQIQTELYSSVMKGLLPFQVAAELFQQIKQPPKTPAPPPTGTVVSDMANVLAKRDTGVATLPTPDMDQANFAGGGIVAFANGGNLVPSGGRVPALSGRINLPASPPAPYGSAAAASRTAGRWMIGKGPLLTGLGIAASTLPFLLGDDEKVEAEPEKTSATEGQRFEMPKEAGVPQVSVAPPNLSTADYDAEIARRREELAGLKPKDRDYYLDQERELMEEAGISDIVAKRQEALAKRQEQTEAERKKAGLMSIAQAGFQMAAAASQPGATFFGSAAQGALEGIKNYADEKERLRQIEAGIEDSQFQLAEAGALREYAALRGGAQLQREAESTYADRSAQLTSLVIGRSDAVNRVKLSQYEAQVRMAVANAELLARSGDQNLARHIAALVNKSTELWAAGRQNEATQYLIRVQDIVNRTSPQVLSKQVGMGGPRGVDESQYSNVTITEAAPKSED